MANTTKNGNNHRNDSKMCKTQPVLNEAWAESSPPQRKERSRLRAKGKVQTRQRQNRQYNYEQTRSTRHAACRKAGGFLVAFMSNHRMYLKQSTCNRCNEMSCCAIVMDISHVQQLCCKLSKTGHVQQLCCRFPCFFCDPGAEHDSAAKALEARRVIRRSSEKIDV